MSESNRKPRMSQNQYTLLFMVILSLVCALILSVLASSLRGPQELAKELDRSRQMLMAARIISPSGYFLIQNEKGEYVPAQFVKAGSLEPTDKKITPSNDQVLEVYRKRIQPFLVNDEGKPTTFKEAGIDEEAYITDFRKSGYYREPWKLIYKIFQNPAPGQTHEGQAPVEGYVIPVNGMGLWDAIYGYLAIKTDGNTVIGISWYDQKETPGLGAEIAEAPWQSQFHNKHIFQESADGTTDFQSASLGISVLKGKVNEILGSSPKALSAVDGMAGATLTGNGVTNAYKDVLAAYRPFLLSVQETFAKTKS
ncbi:putative Na(+)-translocating NADH-quinone reductase subunit C [Candidatus Protochlamydia naegleriophila]|uniref:Na(+)-translocating NADH-quinone reductase subunit C n=1 Tax=Candidatus Protochlamydia naegleriophila TaxID=389348 RepID=A0A0U5K1U0_9BACT|nr:NADH:ubiquinone reductase (Na(+)-transporting) subunit C [Candidatus Protochlamydia naegleriophila]CUI16059.1 putative Na(+)-translocating NADH-quinone reductase subunit C [Candidatus Protochlamydia naegleriophila]